jgi:ABC-type nitrate/sulfonate/bicarbonate transport system substrate-binding protein
MKFHKAAPVVGLALALALAACGGSGGGSASAGSSGGSTPVKFVLNYTPGPQHEEFVVAKESGYYSKAGLDVTMTPPAATTDPVKLVASGQADIGIAYAGDVISAAAQGVPVESVATIHRHNALGLLSKPGSGITTPKSLEGKRVGLTPIPANRALFDEFLRVNHVDASKVEIVPVNFNGPQLVAAGNIDAADAVSFYELGIYKQLTQQEPEFVKFTDFGVPDGYYFTLITSQRFAAKNPDVVKKFVAATLEAEKWTLENPDQANDILIKKVPDVGLEFARTSRGYIKDLVVDDASQKNGLGWSDKSVWARQAKFFKDTGQIDKSVDVGTLFTNDFLPGKPVTVNLPS